MFSERFGKHGRVFITPEKPDMSAILESERTGSFIVDWHRDMAEQKAKETEREVGPGKRKFLWNRADEEYANCWPIDSRKQEVEHLFLCLLEER
ncbi:hypothetical protein FCULG_00012977 [Fusarium culmorum]|uniref:Uncharacterized protein n=1 Tax=Fusarium culmorum TaxID=5516 RepID=A0A2T4GG08_FUSCU|nr:hypothetical protein FCULG_00012977 [Fusarium culmorum]